jgi:hypothetical protein
MIIYIGNYYLPARWMGEAAAHADVYIYDKQIGNDYLHRKLLFTSALDGRSGRCARCCCCCCALRK